MGKGKLNGAIRSSTSAAATIQLPAGTLFPVVWTVKLSLELVGPAGGSRSHHQAG
jgi:hypothetical protein